MQLAQKAKAWDIEEPRSDRASFLEIVKSIVDSFPTNPFCKKADQSELTIQNYHKLLASLFHQVYSSSSTFALAGVNCPFRLQVAREYLLKHADEEKTHWKWILDDLSATGFQGRDPRHDLPSESAATYMAFNYYIAKEMPITRLAVAFMLESLGARLGKEYGHKFKSCLNLPVEGITFFLGHSDTDVIHTEEIRTILDKSGLSPQEWAWMCFAAKTAGNLYRNIYDEAAK